MQTKLYASKPGITYREPTRQNIIEGFLAYYQGVLTLQRETSSYFYWSGSFTSKRRLFENISPGVIQTMVCVTTTESSYNTTTRQGTGLPDRQAAATAFDRKENDPPGALFIHYGLLLSGSNAGAMKRHPGAHDETGVARYLKSKILGFDRAGNEFYVPFQPQRDKVRVGYLAHYFASIFPPRGSEKGHEKR